MRVTWRGLKWWMKCACVQTRLGYLPCSKAPDGEVWSLPFRQYRAPSLERPQPPYLQGTVQNVEEVEDSLFHLLNKTTEQSHLNCSIPAIITNQNLSVDILTADLQHEHHCRLAKFLPRLPSPSRKELLSSHSLAIFGSPARLVANIDSSPT